MRNRILSWLLPAVLLAACENPPRPGETAADSIVLQTDTLPHGFYEDSLASGAIVRLTLTKSGEARLVTDYQNFTPELIQIGSLQPLDSNRLMVSLVKVGSGDPVKDTMTLLWQRDTLVYTGNAYGSEQMLLVAREKPAPVPKDLVVWIKNQSECEVGPGFGKSICYEVQYGDRPVAPQAPWENLSDTITGFSFEKGNLYKLKITRSPRDTATRGFGPYVFRMKELMEKVPQK